MLFKRKNRKKGYWKCGKCRGLLRPYISSLLPRKNRPGGQLLPFKTHPRIYFCLGTNQRIYFTRRTDSNPRLSYKKSTHPTSPRLLCTERQVVLSAIYCRVGWKRLGEWTLCKTIGVCFPFYEWYIFFGTNSGVAIEKGFTQKRRQRWSLLFGGCTWIQH